MKGYSTSEVAKLLGLTPSQVRGYVRAGFLSPERGAAGRLTFSFQDLVFLRTARSLLSARVAPRRIRKALRRLREQLPEGRSLAAVRIAMEGSRIVVADGSRRWQPDSGQILFDFGVADLAKKVAPGRAPRVPRSRRRKGRSFRPTTGSSGAASSSPALRARPSRPTGARSRSIPGIRTPT